MQFLGGKKRKTIRHAKPHLMPEHGYSACAGAIMFDGAFIEHALT